MALFKILVMSILVIIHLGFFFLCVCVFSISSQKPFCWNFVDACQPSQLLVLTTSCQSAFLACRLMQHNSAQVKITKPWNAHMLTNEWTTLLLCPTLLYAHFLFRHMNKYIETLYLCCLCKFKFRFVPCVHFHVNTSLPVTLTVVPFSMPSIKSITCLQ